jgi:hypothetical protein
LSWLFAVECIVLLAIAGAGAWQIIQNRALSEKPQDSAAAALATARTGAGGQLSPYEQMMLRRPRGTLDNATILKLWNANVGTSVILTMIKASAPDYDVGADAIIKLKVAGVDQFIIVGMIDATYNTPITP